MASLRAWLHYASLATLVWAAYWDAAIVNTARTLRQPEHAFAWAFLRDSWLWPTAAIFLAAVVALVLAHGWFLRRAARARPVGRSGTLSLAATGIVVGILGPLADLDMPGSLLWLTGVVAIPHAALLFDAARSWRSVRSDAPDDTRWPGPGSENT